MIPLLHVRLDSRILIVQAKESVRNCNGRNCPRSAITAFTHIDVIFLPAVIFYAQVVVEDSLILLNLIIKSPENVRSSTRPRFVVQEGSGGNKRSAERGDVGLQFDGNEPAGDGQLARQSGLVVASVRRIRHLPMRPKHLHGHQSSEV